MSCSLKERNWHVLQWMNLEDTVLRERERTNTVWFHV